MGPLVQLCMSRMFGGDSKRDLVVVSPLIDLIANFIPSPKSSAAHKARMSYTSDEIPAGMNSCNSLSNELFVNIAKCVHRATRPDVFDAWGRIMSGVISVGDRIKVFGEQYTVEEEEDMSIASVESLWIASGRRLISVDKAYSGQLVFIGGVSSHIAKTATLANVDCNANTRIFRPISHRASVMKVAVEPINPSDLPKMIEGIRRASRSYPALQTRVEESGEHVLMGTGELFLDCVLHDLRNVYSDIEVKVSDPAVTFQETIIESSKVSCGAFTPNKHNKLVMQASVLNPKVVQAANLGHFTRDNAAHLLESVFGFDLVAAQGLWAFGPPAVHSAFETSLSVTKCTDITFSFLFSVIESFF